MTNHNQQYADIIRKQYGLQPRKFRSLECDNEMTAREVAWVALEGSTSAYEKWAYADFAKQLEDQQRLQQSELE